MNNPPHQWNFRPPPPPQANGICPICSNFHFPFCSPPPPPPPPSYAPQNPRFPTRPGYDPRPWHYNVYPHVDRQNLVQPLYDYHGGANGFVSDCDRHYNKRLRVDESSYQVSLEDERRLKLIRDHGGNWAGNKPFSNCNGFNSFDNHVDYSSLQDNDWQKHGPNNQPSPPPPPPPLPSYPPLPLPHYAYDDFNVQRGYLPPLPSSPPPPVPVQSPLPPPVRPTTSLFPVPVSVSSACPSVPHASTEFISEYPGESQSFPLRQLSPDKPKIVDAFHLFKQPHRSTRPDHFVIIVRGLPGSGKSYIAKKLRDLEVENGGDAPRIHSMDDYFMTEVEKNEDGDASKASGSCRGKKAATKIVMEYCYEPEMEEAYRSSMLKAFTRTLDEGNFTFVIVDDRNLRVADFAQFWATAKRSGYEAYILEATYKDPAGCAARNIHGFTLDEIEKMAGQWEEAPTLYWQLDIKSLFHGDDLKESRIKEVEMDMDDVDFESPSAQQVREPNSNTVSRTGDDVAAGFPRNEKISDVEGDLPAEIVKDLGRSKWSNDLDEDDDENTNVMKGNLHPLSGLFQMYGKEGKSVRWGDQVGHTGFSIGAAEKAKMLSLVIGPGAGYNLKSNPLPKEGSLSTQTTANLKQDVFKERLRAEHESFKSVFDRRRQRIGVLGSEEEP